MIAASTKRRLKAMYIVNFVMAGLAIVVLIRYCSSTVPENARKIAQREYAATTTAFVK